MNLTQHFRQNDRFQVAEQADYCVRWLKSQGLEVLAVTALTTFTPSLKPRRDAEGAVTVCPRILVRYSPLCDKLEGAVQGYSRGPRGIEHYKTVVRFDCEVRWKIEVPE